MAATAIIVYRAGDFRSWYKEVSSASTKELALEKFKEEVRKYEKRNPGTTFKIAYFTNKREASSQVAAIARLLVNAERQGQL